ncbi:MAG TPA: thioredoxin-disulfide reductase, partial [Opitutae bacterium]|nr:thioredoxin-disulfide reductase [Opitutae bacterium]
MENLIILGTGCAGLTAGIYAARANLNPLIIEGSQPGGQLTTTSEVENFPGFPEGVDGYELMDRMRKQAERFGTRFKSDWIESVDFEGPVKKLSSGNTTYEAKSIIIATGASPKFLNVPGEQEMFGSKGVSTCATCDGAFYRDMEVVVIGGGDSACEEALFLTRFCSKVTLIHRREELRASPIMAERTLKHEKIEPIWNTIVEAMLPDEEGNVRAVKIRNIKDNTESEISCKGVFIAIGHTPNTNFAEGVLDLNPFGYIVPQGKSMVRTKYDGVFVAGDC